MPCIRALNSWLRISELKWQQYVGCAGYVEDKYISIESVNSRVDLKTF
jgi:hypothetical protein